MKKTLYRAIAILSIGVGLFFSGRALKHFPKRDLPEKWVRDFTPPAEAKAVPCGEIRVYDAVKISTNTYKIKGEIK